MPIIESSAPMPMPTFPDAIGEAAWRAAVDRVLKGAAFETVMTSMTDDRIPVQPLYPKGEGAVPQPCRRAGPIGVVQRVDHPDPSIANGLARADLKGGADGLAIVFDGAASARGFGVRGHDASALDALFDGIDFTATTLRLDASPSTVAWVAQAVAARIDREGLDPAVVAVDTGLGASDGALSLALQRRGYGSPTMRADGRPFHEAGATDAQELASVLASGTDLLRSLEAAGATGEEMTGAIGFVLVADADPLLTMAKLRAMRRLWASVETACGLDPRPIRLHAETAWRTLTRLDPWTNLLRGSVAAAAAMMGGADSLTVQPFTAALGLPDASARRLARNTGRVLLDEAHLGRMLDPAAGAGAYEAMTDALCAKAWTAFQAIEGTGGLAKAMQSGMWPARLAESRDVRQRAIMARERLILGTSLFPAIDDVPPPVLFAAPAEDEGGDGLSPVRDAALWERIAAEPDMRL